ncbi:helix-turn-helix domain-containing protein [Paenibacillus mesophilus]|uniref:AraC family transcriptional regulator n=1 Tax=Paenibacillus mesophilus TaxID=2582849 RepID=UPI00110D7F0D|nr:AraC family transcriptional regulator [Paenibacillus mesophilus]TMV49466.1 helix-turn-helix domain-containing protein [Paenibacillus mesophilus]
MYQDSLAHEQFGKSRLPMFVVKGRITSNIPLHHHNFAELSLVVEGSGTEIINGKPHPFQKGSVSFLLPHHIHEVQLNSPTAIKYNCMFDLHLLFLSPSDRDLANALLKTGLQYPSHYDLDEDQATHMLRLFESMKQEYENDRFAKESALRSMLMEAFIILLRTPHPAQHSASALVETRNNMEDILHYLHIHYQEEITLSVLAKQFNRNASYISRMFKQLVGRTFTEYLHMLRVGRAASLLATTSMSITDIAIDVGFDHTRTFTRAFKEAKGTTPKQFRAIRQRQQPIE